MKKNKEIDVNNIYSIIDHTEPDLPKQPKVRRSAFKENYMNIGLFIKLISNTGNVIFEAQNAIQDEYDIYSAVDSGKTLEICLKHMLYAKAYDNLIRVDFSRLSHIKVALKFNPELLDSSLILALNHFEGLEDYNKCYNLKTFKDKVDDLRLGL